MPGPGAHPALVFGSMPESGLGERTQPLREKYRQMDWTILAGSSHVELVGRTSDPALLEAARADFAQDLAPDLAFVGVRRRHRGHGGGPARRPGRDPGGGREHARRQPGGPGHLHPRRAARCSSGGATVYSARAKAALAGLDPGFIAAHGTVSEPVTAALAEAVRTRLGTTWGLAVTGNAGPTEDQDGPAPVGTTVMAVAGPAGTE